MRAVKKSVSAIIMVVMFGQVQAAEVKASDIILLQEERACGGYARTGFIRTNDESNPDERATAVGGEINCEFPLNRNINIQLGLSTSIDPGVNNDNDILVHGDFFDNDKDSYVLLGEASLNASFGKLGIHLGRHIYDSPHMDSDDLRIIPNRFEDYQINYEFNEDITLGFSYLRKMAGWENGNNHARFVDIGTALGADGGDVYVVWGSYEREELSVQLWNYRIKDIENIFYAEAIYGTEYNKDISWEVGVQYDQGRDIGSTKLGNIDADTWGLNALFIYKAILFSAAYNQNYGDSGAVSSLGGGSFFTSMEDQTLDAVTGSDARAIALGIEIEAIHDLVVGFVASDFQASNKSVYHMQENDFYVNYNWNDRLNLEAVYADINDISAKNDKEQLRVIMTYEFEGFF